MTLTHASWFSGVGGLDMGLEAAGWETVSFSEIDPYASAVLAHRWPGVPNLGSIVAVADAGRAGEQAGLSQQRASTEPRRRRQRLDDGPDWRDAFLWTGGFPCQDLSVAGKRRGIVEGSRSGLAITFLDLVERHRPPAIILENVPGLLSSHAGRDFGALLGRLGELGYWWAYRVLDARYFGVPQRRRRVFIVALHAGIGATADSPAEVLSVGSRCDRHPATGGTPGPGVAGESGDGADIVGTIPAGLGHHGNGGHSSQAVASGHVIPGIRPAAYADRMRGAHGLAAGLDDRAELDVAATLNSGGNNGGFRTEPGEHLTIVGTIRADSHRYRCCGNGVVAPVAEFVGERLRVVVERLLAERAA